MAEQAMTRPELRRAHRARRRRRRIVAVAAGVAVVGGGSAAIAATADSGPTLQLATVSFGMVTQTIESSGTVTASTKQTAQFPVSGTVKSVAVAVGDKVTAGQRLAQLDTTALQTSVDSVDASLAAARQKLSSDESGQVASGSGQTASGSAQVASVTTDSAGADILVSQIVDDSAAAAARGPSTAPTGSTSVPKAQAAVIAAQKQVDAGQTDLDAAQKQVDTDITQNTKLRDAQVTACAPSTSPSGSTASPPPTPADCTAASADYAAFADTLATDTAAVDAKLAAQDGYVKTLDAAITALDAAIAHSGSSSGGSGSGGSGGSGPGGSGSTHGSGSGGTTSSGTQSGGSRTGSATSHAGTGGTATGATGSTGSGSGGANSSAQPASAAQLAADQASIDALTAQLAEAKQNLAAATLTSPSAGIVGAVGYTPGTSSSGASITIVGTGVEGVQTSVPLGQIDSVKVGQPVTVAADGQTASLHGTVESIGLLSTTSGSRTTFPVTVRLAANSPMIYDGSGANVVITTGSARSVPAVPTSALHTGRAGTYTVTVVTGSKQSTVRVSIGLAGTDLTQVTSGLKVGQKVLLADLAQPLPGSANTSTTFSRFGGGTGRFGGAGTGTTRGGG